MTSNPLDYISTHTPRRWPWRVLITTAVLLIALFVLSNIEMKRTECRVDAVTGTMSWKQFGLFGGSSGTRIDVSPLKTRLKRRGIAWTPSWRFLSEAEYTLFGTKMACGLAPPIYSIRPLLCEFSAASTAAELRQFVNVMQSGAGPQQQAAVDAATEKAFKG